MTETFIREQPIPTLNFAQRALVCEAEQIDVKGNKSSWHVLWEYLVQHLGDGFVFRSELSLPVEKCAYPRREFHLSAPGMYSCWTYDGRDTLMTAAAHVKTSLRLHSKICNKFIKNWYSVDPCGENCPHVLSTLQRSEVKKEKQDKYLGFSALVTKSAVSLGVKDCTFSSYCRRGTTKVIIWQD